MIDYSFVSRAFLRALSPHLLVHRSIHPQSTHTVPIIHSHRFLPLDASPLLSSIPVDRRRALLRRPLRGLDATRRDAKRLSTEKTPRPVREGLGFRPRVENTPAHYERYMGDAGLNE